MSLICAATVQTEDKGLDHCSSASNICCGEARFEHQGYRVVRELKAMSRGVLLPCSHREFLRTGCLRRSAEHRPETEENQTGFFSSDHVLAVRPEYRSRSGQLSSGS